MNVYVAAVLGHVLKDNVCPPSRGWIHQSRALGLPSLPPPSRHCSHHSRRWIASPGTVPLPTSPPNMTSEACSLRPPGVWRPLRGSRYLILQISCSFKTYQEGSGSGQARGTQDSACQHACNCSRANGGAAMLFRTTKRHGYDDQSLESLSGMTL